MGKAVRESRTVQKRKNTWKIKITPKASRFPDRKTNIHNTGEAVLSKPMAPITEKIIQTYLDQFVEGMAKILVPNTKIKIKAIAFDCGVLFEISLNDRQSANKILLREQSTVLQAFEALQLNIEDFLEADDLADLENAIESNEVYFEGSNLFFDDDRFYLVKDLENNSWTKASVKNDVKRINEEVKKLLPA